MGLREEAIAAAAAAVSLRQTAARAVLASRLNPAEVNGLTVEATTADLVVFTDGTMHLAVRDSTTPKTVFLVQPDDSGDWTRIAAVADLPTLGALLSDDSDPT